MSKMGRPKKDKPINHVVSVKFSEEEYQLLIEYAKSQNESVSHILRYGAMMQINNSKQ